MPVSYFPVQQDVLDMALNIVNAHHPMLEGSTINVVFRDKASRSQGQLVLGSASKVSPKVNAALAGIDEGPMHFIITLAFDTWENMNMGQQMALLDHELTHCYLNADKEPRLRGHDIEEFFSIVERHGAWRDSIRIMDESIETAKQANLFKLHDEVMTTLQSLVESGAEMTIELAKADANGRKVDLNTGEILETALPTQP